MARATAKTWNRATSEASKNAGKKLLGNAARRAVSLVDVLGAMKDLAGYYAEVAKVKEVSKVKIAEIEANRQISLAEIEARKQIVQQYFESSFKERSSALASYFQLADTAIAKGDREALQMVVAGIIELSKSGPFKDLASDKDTRRALNDPNHEWEV